MISTKTLLTAASLAVLTLAGAGAANAAPWDHRGPTTRIEMRHDTRQDFRRQVVSDREVYQTLRMHRLRAISEPTFLRGHLVVRVAGRFGRPSLIEINPYTGRLIGEFRI